jgi:hypothetical protein
MSEETVSKLREPEARILALRIAATFPGGEVSTTKIKELVPEYRELSPADLMPSTPRSNEKMWQQIVGNVVSHQTSSTSLFNQGLAERMDDGIRITEKGREYLKKLSY